MLWYSKLPQFTVAYNPGGFFLTLYICHGSTVPRLHVMFIPGPRLTTPLFGIQLIMAEEKEKPNDSRAIS